MGTKLHPLEGAWSMAAQTRHANQEYDHLPDPNQYIYIYIHAYSIHISLFIWGDELIEQAVNRYTGVKRREDGEGPPATGDGGGLPQAQKQKALGLQIASRSCQNDASRTPAPSI